MRAPQRERAVRGCRVGGPIGGGGGSRSCRPTSGRGRRQSRRPREPRRAGRDARTAIRGGWNTGTRRRRHRSRGASRVWRSLRPSGSVNKKKCLFPRLAFVPVSTSGISRSSPASLRFQAAFAARRPPSEMFKPPGGGETRSSSTRDAQEFGFRTVIIEKDLEHYSQFPPGALGLLHTRLLCTLRRGSANLEVLVIIIDVVVHAE